MTYLGKRRAIWFSLLAILFAEAARPALAETLATPETLSIAISTAKAGDTIRLVPGRYNSIYVRSHHWSPAVIVDAGAATLSSLRFDDLSGLIWNGGDFEGGDVIAGAIKFYLADHISVSGASFNHYINFGIHFTQVVDSKIVNNVFTNSGGDGVDIAMSQRILVDHNRCTDTHPVLGAHPDCVQMWSKPNLPPTADIVISNNVAIGDTQGFTGFNHVVAGVDDGGFDRITIENNYAKVAFWHGIGIYACRHCVVRHNRADSLPNPKFPAARAWIRVAGDADLIDCDNLATAYPNDANRRRCPTGR